MRQILWITVFLVAGACTGTPSTDYSNLPEFFDVPIEATGVIDRRPEFANIFCALLEADQTFSEQPCTDFLHLQDLASVETIEVPRLQPERLRYLIIPGYGSGCFAGVAGPFENAREALREEGIDIELLMVPSRASTAHNAEFIAQALQSEADNDATEMVLIGYSKGLADILEAVVDYPHALSRVVAVVGISGVVYGTPIASDVPIAMRLLDRSPLNGCRGSDTDGNGLQSISYEHRQNWLATHRLDPRILYFSLAAYATVDEISTGLKAPYRKLARIDPRNDGLMIYRDAIIPGSALLALARGDHWAVAMPFSESNVIVRGLVADRNLFPRSVLLRSIMIAVQRELDAAGSR